MGGFTEYGGRCSFSAAAVLFLVAGLVLEVLHEPLEYLDVAVHGDVDVVDRGGFGEVLFKVLHVLDQ